jgi:hypothetical protein
LNTTSSADTNYEPKTTNHRVSRGAWRIHALALCGYVVVALFFTWPLPRHLHTHLPGSPEGDTGVYVWNLWVFHYEVTEHRTLPYFTDRIFRGTGRANLSLHNYTAFANLLALPFVTPFGIIAAFNAVYLTMTVLTAYAMFLLARRFCANDPSIAWVSGLGLAWAPFFVTRGMGHYSLVAAAPLPIFVLLLLRLQDRHSWGDSVRLGATVAWATACDVYYGVYCVILAIGYLIARVVRLRRRASPPAGQLFIRAVDLLTFCLAGLVAVLLVGQGWQFAFLGRVVRVRTVYTPLLILTALVLLRLAAYYRPAVQNMSWNQFGQTFRVAALAGAVATVLMSPLLLAMMEQVQTGRFVRPRIFWRSSPPGIDLLAWFTPNPNHPLAPQALREWLAGLTRDGFLENVASVPLIALAVIAIAVRQGWRPPASGLAITVGFGLLASGPFLRIGGIDTHVPGPWAILRYVPIVGLARSPSRFAVFVALGVAAMFAAALYAIVERRPAARRLIVALVTLLIVAELWPSPRALFSAEVPSIYRIIAADPREDAAVLELPFGIRDGTMSVGNFTSRTQFYQTAHGKPILGGYLSRVSQRRLADTRRDAVLQILVNLSEGQPLSSDDSGLLKMEWQAFVRRTSIGYVVVDHGRASPDLQSLTATTLRLPAIGAHGAFHLYRPE